MGRLKFNTEISVSNLLAAAVILTSVMIYVNGIHADISAEAHAREMADTEFSANMKQVSKVLDDLESRVRCNDTHRITVEAGWKK